MKQAVISRWTSACVGDNTYWLNVSIRGEPTEHAAEIVENTVVNWAIVAGALLGVNGDDDLLREETPEQQVLSFFDPEKVAEEAALLSELEEPLVTVWNGSRYVPANHKKKLDDQETTITIHSNSSPTKVYGLAKALIEATSAFDLSQKEKEQTHQSDDVAAETEKKQQAANSADEHTDILYPFDKDQRAELEKQLAETGETVYFNVGKMKREGDRIKFYYAIGAGDSSKWPGKMSMAMKFIKRPELKEWIKKIFDKDGAWYDIQERHNVYWKVAVRVNEKDGRYYWNAVDLHQS